MVLRGGIEPPFKDVQSTANPSQLPKHMNGTGERSRTSLIEIKSFVHRRYATPVCMVEKTRLELVTFRLSAECAKPTAPLLYMVGNQRFELRTRHGL